MYTYEYLNQMVSRSFDPDGAGTEPAQTTYYAYQGGQIVFQFDDPTPTTTEPSHRYFWNPLAVDQLFADENTATSTVLWAITDQQGTVRDLATHDSGTGATTVVLHRDYDAWGNLTSATGSLLGDYDYAFNEQTHDIVNTIAATDELFGYTGRAFDEATGLQNNLNRWYDPKTGRFLGEDPIGFAGDHSNKYRYIGNSPLTGTDPSGLDGPFGPLNPPPTSLSISFENDWNSGFAGWWNAAHCDCEVRGAKGKTWDWAAMNGKLDKFINDGRQFDRVIIEGHASSGSMGGLDDITNPNSDARKFLEKLAKLLKPGAKIELRGCDVAKGQLGKQYISDMAKILRAEVIAYDDLYAVWPYGKEWHADSCGRLFGGRDHGPYKGSLPDKIQNGKPGKF